MRKTVTIGPYVIGGNNPIVIQSMTNTFTHEVDATVSQIKRLEDAGCEIIRLAVPDERAARALSAIKSRVALPMVADIHFDHTLALMAIAEGIDALRLNPGNIKKREHVEAVVDKAAHARIPIRIGVNAGSIDRSKYPHPTPEALVESALSHVTILEELGFHDIKVSLKAYDIPTTVEAYRLFSKKRDYPLHIGITEAGGVYKGTIRSAVGIGVLLYEGLGDTIRVSLTGDPVEEVKAAKEILSSLNLRTFGIDIISCPTCGRTEIPLEEMLQVIQTELSDITVPLKIAVMGCVVNGPGEAKDADLGIAGGKGEGIIFVKGEIIGKYPEKTLVQEFIAQVRKYAKEYAR